MNKSPFLKSKKIHENDFARANLYDDVFFPKRTIDRQKFSKVGSYL